MKHLFAIALCLALLGAAVARAANWGFWDDQRSFVGLEIKTNAVVLTNWYSLWSGAVLLNPPFTNKVIGVAGPLATFNPGAGDSLRILAYDTKTWKTTGGDVSACEYFYARYADGNRGTPTFTSIGGGWLEDLGSGNQKWGNGNVWSANIASGLSTVTNRLEIVGSITGATDPVVKQWDNNGGYMTLSGYSAQFLVIPEGGLIGLLTAGLGWLFWRKR